MLDFDLMTIWVRVMARLKQILIGCLATIVILFVALKVRKVSVYTC